MDKNEFAFLSVLTHEAETQLSEQTSDVCAWLPGYPDIGLDEIERLKSFLIEELECKDLDQLSQHLWIMSTQSSANISPLNRQRVKGREVIISEDPKLHLIWFYDKIYVKPIPQYLLSYRFWKMYILHSQQPLGKWQNIIRTSALGFLRSYAYLIRYESDLRIAKERSLALVPESISWGQWCILRSKILAIRDEDVSGRYRFGEIRLTRLNFYCKFLLSKTYYHRTHRQYRDYFASFYPPLLFIFGILSVMLGSMQLAATLEQIETRWHSLLEHIRIFSVLTSVIACILVAGLILLFFIKITNEWVFALRCRWSSRARVGVEAKLKA